MHYGRQCLAGRRPRCGSSWQCTQHYSIVLHIQLSSATKTINGTNQDVTAGNVHVVCRRLAGLAPCFLSDAVNYIQYQFLSIGHGEREATSVLGMYM